MHESLQQSIDDLEDSNLVSLANQKLTKEKKQQNIHLNNISHIDKKRLRNIYNKS